MGLFDSLRGALGGAENEILAKTLSSALSETKFSARCRACWRNSAPRDWGPRCNPGWGAAQISRLPPNNLRPCSDRPS